MGEEYIHPAFLLLLFTYPVHDWTSEAVLGHLKIMCKQIYEMYIDFCDKILTIKICLICQVIQYYTKALHTRIERTFHDFVFT